jgi:membrane-bound inhibitor of C-type lysozyme
MIRRDRAAAGALLLATLMASAACHRSAPPPPAAIGGAQDAHGCYPSAGYSWCEATHACIRPWETYCTAAAPNRVRFTCDRAITIDATFYPTDDKFVDLVFSDGRHVSLPHAMSGSGARYAREDERLVFWNKGNTAFVDENGKTTIDNCVAK